MVEKKTVKLTQISILAALVVVLQVLGYALPAGTFNLSLVLIPIVVGGVLFGASVGASLGAVFGLVVLIACIFGFDKGGNILWNVSPLLTALVCLGKGVAAGAAGGAVAALFRKLKIPAVGIFAAAITVPVVNTGLFITALWLFFRETLIAWAGGQDVVYYVFIGLVGVNFLIELGLNLVLAPITKRIIMAVRRVSKTSSEDIV